MRTPIVSACCHLVLLAGSIGIGGCQALSPPPPSARIERARTAYNSSNYRKAYREAMMATGNHDGAVRDEGTYLAGMSAYKMGQIASAERHLRTAAHSGEPLLSGQSQAQLGLIYSKQNRYGAASEPLLGAARKLHGQDRANAYYYAGIAQQNLGRWAQARTSLTLARNASKDPTFQQNATDKLAVTGYTIQFGAFGSETNAQRQAKQITSRLRPARAGLVRIKPSDNAGSSTLYVVHVGQYTTFESALATRNRIGANEAIVVPLTRRLGTGGRGNGP